MADDRLTLALPIDVAWMFDLTTSSALIDANTFPGGGVKDAEDTLASMIEDAEDEFHSLTNSQMRVGRVGVAGKRETYETVPYDVSGHQAYKRNWSGVSTDYRPTERTVSLDNDRVLPFDPAEGDECYVYRGLRGTTGGSEWEEITDKRGELWDIVNYTSGEMVFHPAELQRAMRNTRQGVSLSGASQLREVRFAISYRYGGLGGSRGSTARTTLASGITDTQTGSVAVTDGSGFPTAGSSGSIVVMIDREYLSVVPSPENDSMEIIERGVRGTTPASHAADARVQYTPPAVRKAVAARAAEQLVASGRYQDWLPETEDDLGKSDMADQFSDTWEKTVAALSA